MRVALDTNILVYAEGVNGPVRQRAATALLDSLLGANVVIPVQVLGELLHVLTQGRTDQSGRTGCRTGLAQWLRNRANNDR